MFICMLTAFQASWALFNAFFRATVSTVIYVKNCRSKKGVKQCLGGLKCVQNAKKKKKKKLKVSFNVIFNANFANLVSKEYFSYNVL